jgi:hypothetical protein
VQRTPVGRQFDLLLGAVSRISHRQPGERLGAHDDGCLVPGALKGGQDGGRQFGELVAVLPASEQVDVAARPVPDPVCRDGIPARERQPAGEPVMVA